MFGRNLIKIFILMWIPASSSAQTQTGSIETGSIEGRVGNLFTGSPVRKAQVLLSVEEPNQTKYQAVTDAEGRYVMRGVAPGRYRLWVQRPGFLPVVYGASGPNRPGKSVVVSAGGVKKDMNFLIEPPAVITGHVYDEEGDPISIPIVLWRQAWRDGRRSPEQAGGTMSDDEGEFRIYGLPSGTYLVSTAQSSPRAGQIGGASSPSRETYPLTFYPGTDDFLSATPLKLAPGSEARGIDFHLRKTVSVSIRGIVVNANPGEQFSVALSRRDGLRDAPKSQGPVANVTNNEFTVERVVPGSYILTAASAVGHPFFGSANIDVGTLDMVDVRISVSTPAPIQVTVRLDGEGQEAPKGMVVLSRASPSPGGAEQGLRMAVGPEGKFQWNSASPGTWMIGFTPLQDDMYLKSPAEVEITPGFAGPLEVVVSTRGAEVTGKVTGKVPVEAATVLLLTDGKQPHVVKYAISDPDGKYLMRGIPPGKYRLLALEDIETSSWEDPAVAAAFEGKGLSIDLAPSAKTSQDLTLGPR
jgi:Carboxypeptidase regulatory-like domain